MLDVEWQKLLKHPLMWLELAGLAGLLVAYFVLRDALLASSAHPGAAEARSLELDLRDGLELFSFMSVAFYAAAGALIVGYDFPERGVQEWLVRGVPRPLLLLARLIILLLLSFMLIAVATSATLGGAALGGAVFLHSVPALDLLSSAQLSATVLRMFWGAVPYLALTLLLAVVSRSPLFAASGTVVFRTVLENLLLNLSDRFPNLIRFLPAQLAFVLELPTYALDRAAASAARTMPLLAETQAALVVAAILMIFTVASAVVFSRQDWGG